MDSIAAIMQCQCVRVYRTKGHVNPNINHTSFAFKVSHMLKYLRSPQTFILDIDITKKITIA